MDQANAPSLSRVPPAIRSIRARNRCQVLDLLCENGVLSQADIARHTGLSRTTISNLVSELRSKGLVAELESGRASVSAQGGRPPVLIGLDDSAGAAAGIDFGHRHVRVAVASLTHSVLGERVQEVRLDEDPHGSLEVAASLVEEVLTGAAVDRSRVIGVGMGLPAPIDRSHGMVASTAGLTRWRELSPAGELSARLRLPVELDSEVNLAALGETVWGSGRGCAQIAYIQASSEIGCGLVIDGRVFRGARGMAGQIAHTIVDRWGLVCQCGSRGCLETLAGGSAIIELLRRSHGEPLTLSRVLMLAVEGDACCRRAICDVSGEIGVAVANLCNLLNPERVVIGGTLGQGGEIVLQPIREAVHRATMQFTTEVAEVVPAALGDRAQVLGAAALAMRETNRHFSLRLGASPQTGC